MKTWIKTLDEEQINLAHYSELIFIKGICNPEIYTLQLINRSGSRIIRIKRTQWETIRETLFLQV